jgi:hypothetical protein
MESKEQTGTQPLGLSSPKPADMIKTPATEKAWEEWIEPVLDVLAKVPDYIGQFFTDYKRPLTTVGLFIAAIITVKITLAVLDAIDDVPLLGAVLELVGLGYTAWFVYRYLWKASSRQDLFREFEALKNQIFGDNLPSS